jgi:hypothetical protein
MAAVRVKRGDRHAIQQRRRPPANARAAARRGRRPGPGGRRGASKCDGQPGGTGGGRDAAITAAAATVSTARGAVIQVAAPDVPITVKASPTMLRQAVENLLDNAARYADAGPVQVDVRPDPDAGLSRWWSLTEAPAPRWPLRSAAAQAMASDSSCWVGSLMPSAGTPGCRSAPAGAPWSPSACCCAHPLSLAPGRHRRPNRRRAGHRRSWVSGCAGSWACSYVLACWRNRWTAPWSPRCSPPLLAAVYAGIVLVWGRCRRHQHQAAELGGRRRHPSRPIPGGPPPHPDRDSTGA